MIEIYLNRLLRLSRWALGCVLGAAALTLGAQAADDAGHWAFQPVPRGNHPLLKNEQVNCANPIDVFIDHQLEQVGLERSPEADRRTLIRRLYLNLLGVPPTPEELSRFVNDPEPNAFESLVDQTLNDPRYGERWARHWLDVIRFAETNGFETNRERLNAWRFRDYVIDFFNEDKPYDQFVREQIAGDVFGADVGTGFLVGGPLDIVKSPDPGLTAKQRADELDDMVNTTGMAFMGLTLGCARCHSHKFDPVTHEDYYSMTAMFSGVRHGDRPAPASPESQEMAQRLKEEVAALESKLQKFTHEVKNSNNAQKSGADLESLEKLPAVQSDLNVDSFDPIEITSLRFMIFASSGAQPCIDELEVFSCKENVGLASNGVEASASSALPGYAIHKIKHLNDGKFGNSHSWISNEVGQGWAQLDFPDPTVVDRVQWGRDRSGAIKDRLPVLYRIEARLPDGSWKIVSSSDRRETFPGSIQQPTDPVYIFDGFSAEEADAGRALLSEIASKREALKRLENQTMIFAGNFSKPDPAYVLHRGDPLMKKEEVSPSTLSIFKPVELARDASDKDRRTLLANWITDETNPLTSRVMVNRVWQFQFGAGIVDTPSDFGLNGSIPTHPELINWMADFLISNNWSIKTLQRQIVLSKTWRQSSQPSAKAMKVDAGSRLLWRYPPRRMEAEAIRDSILAVSGLLNYEMGGPSFYLHDVDRENVYHYHPKEEFGMEDMRRMVYAFKVRMEPDAIFGAFDCPDGSLAVPKRSVSTTPLQALNLFNSPFLMQQAEALTKRLNQENSDSALSVKITRLWRLLYGRDPESDETEAAIQLVNEHGMVSLCRATLNSNEFLFIP
jgi:hypothetical protein